jgi:hypothetical protein
MALWGFATFRERGSLDAILASLSEGTLAAVRVESPSIVFDKLGFHAAAAMQNDMPVESQVVCFEGLDR